MAAVYTLEIRLDDKGVVTGVRNITAQVEAMAGGLRKAGQTGNLVSTEMIKQHRQANDAASLLARTFGIEMPRQLEKFLSKSSLIGPALSTAFNASIILAAGAAVIALIPQIQEAASAVGGFTKAMREVEQAAIDANNALLAAMGRKAFPEIDKNIDTLTNEHNALKKSRGEWDARNAVLTLGVGNLVTYALQTHKLAEGIDKLDKAQALRAKAGEEEQKKAKETAAAIKTLQERQAAAAGASLRDIDRVNQARDVEIQKLREQARLHPELVEQSEKTITAVREEASKKARDIWKTEGEKRATMSREAAEKIKQFEAAIFKVRLEAGRSFEKDQADANKRATEQFVKDGEARIAHNERVIEAGTAIIDAEREA
ncbi:MAG: hypothetical protein M3O85_07135, partial [Acidobacteriota bacterium]|nr:hypothetical protein [Acidobacteriota bacterium]